jgi:hypothetical protein
MNLGDLTFETAKPLAGTTFEVRLPDGRITTLKLDEALAFEHLQRRARRNPKIKRDPFSLFFLGSPTEILPQGMYTLHSENVVFEELFLVPIGQDEQAIEYEAVFT